MSETKTHRIGIIMNGVTGRMGTNQHLMRSLVPIIQQGGVKIGEREFIMPDPILVGRNPVKLEKLRRLSGLEKTSVNLEPLLADPDYPVYFDAQTTDRRCADVMRAIKAGKHVYCEKPIALTCEQAMQMQRAAETAGVKTGVVQDKLWLPGFRKLKRLIDSGCLGRIHSVRGEFGYWVFEGDGAPPQRPSWNYRAEDGGGMALDMLPHWRYLLDNLFGEVKALCCSTRTHVAQRWDESGNPYQCTADDAAYATFELENQIIAQFNSSWATRVRRDDLLTVLVDGDGGSAVAGLRKVWMQPAGATPRAVWNPDIEQPLDFYQQWLEVPDTEPEENAFKAQWELFLRHLVDDTPFRWTLLEGAKGVQLAELAYQSHKQRGWVEVPVLQ